MRPKSAFKSIVYIFILTMLGSSCIFDSDEDKNKRNNSRPEFDNGSILFIGSSYLSYGGNNVVEMFDSMASRGGHSVYTDSRVINGKRLQSHLEDPATIQKIQEEKWDFVILQGAGFYISKEKWHEYIVPVLRDFKKIIKKNSKRTCMVYMMPWAYKDGLAWMEGEEDTYQQMHDGILNNTIKVMHDLDICTAPAGKAWHAAILDGYSSDFYLSDNSHQSKHGAYLTACVFYSTVFLEKAPQLDLNWDYNDNIGILNETAYTTVVDSLDAWNIY